MRNLHICSDHNFVENSRSVFEKYYPKENIFIVNSRHNSLKIINDTENFKIVSLTTSEGKKTIEELCEKYNVDNVLLHGISIGMFPLLKDLKEFFKFKIYWIFWGYELYQMLGYEKGYPLIDKSFSFFDRETYFLPNKFSKFLRKITKRYLPNTVCNLIPYIDYFCFWNKSDYELMQKYYPSDIKFKYFAYSSNYKGIEQKGLFQLEDRDTSVIMVNHQASLFGNYDTVMNRIFEVNRDNHFEIIAPLSYGNYLIRKNSLKLGSKLFGNKFNPILEYMSRDEYFKILSRVDVAVFGQRRQEASGNIIQLLKNGVKIFLRNDNNLLQYYRLQGYIIYSFEDDLNSKESLRSLTLEEKYRNRNCYFSHLKYYDDFMPNLFEDI